MELNREQVVKALEKWMKNYDGRVTNFVTLGNAIGLIEELTEKNEKLNAEIADREMSHINLYGEMRERIKQTKADTIHKMQTMIKKECIAGGIYPAFVARVVERVGEKLLEGKNDV